MYIDHSVYLWTSLDSFDVNMQFYADDDEVRSERKALYERIEDYIRDLKELNVKASLEQCSSVFAQVFQPKTDLPSLEQILSYLAQCLGSYRDLSKGPYSEHLLAERVESILQFISKAVQSTSHLSSRDHEDFMQILAKVEKHREEATENEARLRGILEETIDKHAKLIELRDLQLAETQSSMNRRAQEAEGKVRELQRENGTLRLDLENAEREKDLFIQAAKDLYEVRLIDLRNELGRRELERKELEMQIDSLIEEHQAAIADKNQQISELSAKVRLMQSQSEPAQKEDLSVLLDFKEHISDVVYKASGERTSRVKSVSLAEALYSAQSNLNKTRLDEQDRRHRMIEEYEEQLRELRRTSEDSSRRSTLTASALISELRQSVEELKAAQRTNEAAIFHLTKKLQVTGE
jgi:hypothetical protein